MSPDRIEAAALELSASERARLARLLIASLDEEPAEDQAEVERAWEQEIRRRLEEFRAGRTRTSPADQVVSEARARLR
jgi:putative addiction module component (TIGR02574 family)